MKIGDSDLATYTDVETEIGTNPSLFSQDIDENSIGVEMDDDGDTTTRSSAVAADELSLDWVNASGLFGADSSGNLVGVTQSVRVEYSMRLRRQDGTVAISSVTFEQYDEPSRSATLVTPMAGVNYEDLVTFGETGSDVLSLVITRIEPAADFAAKITAVDAAPFVLTADAGTPPPWTSSITGQAQVEAPEPPSTVDVNSSQLLSTSDDGGVTQPVMMVAVTGPWSGVSRTGAAMLDHIDVRYRTSDPVGAWTVLALPYGELSTTIYGITRGLEYQVEARAVGSTGRASAWTAVTHTTADATLAPDEVPELTGDVDTHTGRAEIDWTPVPQADVSYLLQYTDDPDVTSSTDESVTWNRRFQGAALTATDVLGTDALRSYRVRAFTYAGVAGAWSNLLQLEGPPDLS